MGVAGMSNYQEQIFSAREELDQALAAEVANRLRAEISSEGRASLVVSGGSTPVHFFSVLANAELDWSKVTVTLADERWVDNTHEASNELLVRTNLLQNKAANAQFIPLKTPANTAVDGETALANSFSNIGKFTVVILGMGGDGHTASLFPGADGLARAMASDASHICQAITPLTAPHERMTLTAARLLDAHHLVIHITGEAKREVLERAKGLEDQAELPISLFLQQESTPTELYWAP
jgi:6-phosphogluconolactonase